MQKVTDNIFLLVVFAIVGTLILASSFILFFLRYQRHILKQKNAIQKAELEHGEQLLNATITSQEKERRRIGSDLHDDVGTSLSNLKMVLAQTQTEESYKPLIDKIMTTVRGISHNLNPPGLDLFGFEQALYELFDGFNNSKTLQVLFTNNAGVELDNLPKQTSLALYRVFQELLNNTIKHAEAKNVDISAYNNENKVVFIYKDDGKGMPAKASQIAGMGMQNIEARLNVIKATFEINSQQGKGFEIRITANKK